MLVKDFPAWLRRETITSSHRRSTALAVHLARLVHGWVTTHDRSAFAMAHLVAGLQDAGVPYVVRASLGAGGQWTYELRTGRYMDNCDVPSEDA